MTESIFVSPEKAAELNKAQGGNVAFRIGRLPDGREVRVLKQNGDGQNSYLKVVLSGGSTKWVLDEKVEVVR